jgi:phage terminase large subunit GpA-like protein
LKQWTNTVLAETWEEGGEKVDPDSLFARREPYEPALLPAKVGLLTAGVDIQDNRFECEIVGWGASEENWSIEYVVHFADPASPAYWEALDDVLQRTYAHPTGAGLKIEAIASTPAVTIRKPFMSFAGRASAGASSRSRAPPGPDRPVWPKKATRNVAKKTDVFVIGVDQAKSVMAKRLMIMAKGPGYCHFPQLEAYDEAYFDGLTVEKCLTKFKLGRPFKVWECPPGKRNEPWDCRLRLRGLQIDAARHCRPPGRS